MSSVDNRIVKMQLENAQFTSAANSTMNTLKKLGDTLKLSEGAKGLENVANKAKNIDMSALSESVEVVKNRFSALDIVGVTALVNITNSAVESGKRMLKSLTIDPITSGFKEYELKMNSVQTIMASTGAEIEVVTEYLEELNLYSDKTIYSFSDMTENIGKFTNAGVKLEDAVAAIKGISNEAAVSGANANEASRAMYNFAQALSAGSVKLIDWKSIELANMATLEFKNELIDTAVAMGTLVKVGDMYQSTTTDNTGHVSDLFDATKVFNESLSSQWMTTEVLVETLKDYADETTDIGKKAYAAAQDVKTFSQMMDNLQETAQSGWAVTWETVFGNLEEGTILWTSMSKALGGLVEMGSIYRNENLKIWKDLGGREALIKGFANIFSAIGNLLIPIYESFNKIINPWNGERLAALSKGFEAISGALRITETTGALVGKTFDGLFSIFKLIGIVLKPIGSLIQGLVTGLAGTGSSLLDVFFGITSFLTGWISNVANFIEQSQALQTAMDWMYEAGVNLSNMFDILFTTAQSWIGVGLDYAKTFIDEFTIVMGDLMVTSSAKIEEIKVFVTEFNDAYQPLTKVKDFVVGVFEAIQNGIQDFIDFTKDAIKSIRSFFDSIVERVKDSNIQAIDFVNAGLFASLLLVIKKMIPVLKNFFGAVGNFKDSAIGVLDELQDVLKSYQKNIKANMIQKIAIAVGILAASIWVLSKVDPARLIPAVAALGVLMGGLVLAFKQVEKLDPKEFAKSASTITMLIGVSISLTIIASALKKIADLEWSEVARGIVGMGAVFLLVRELIKSLDGAKLDPKIGTSLLVISTSLIVLSGALAIIGNLETETLIKSLITLTAVMGGLSLFFKSVKKVGDPSSVAKSMLPIATSLLILSAAFAILGNMDPNTLLQGLVVMGAALTEVAAFVKMIDSFKGDMKGMGAGLLLLSTSMLILAGAFAILGNMDIAVLAQGLGTLAAVLVMLTVAMKLMPNNMPKFSGDLLILSASLLVLSFAMKKFGDMSLEQIGKSLVMLAGTFAVFALAALLLGPLVTPMMAVAGAIALLGAACSVVGVALSVLSVGITMLSGSIVGAGVAMTAALMSLSTVIPILAASIALGLVSFLTVLGYNAVAIQRALTQLLAALLRTINENIPMFVKVVVTFLSEMISAVRILAPQLVDAIVEVLTSVMDALIILTPKLVETVVTIVISVMDALIILTPKLVETVVTIVISVIDALTTNLPILADMVLTFVVDMIMAVLNNIAEAIPRIAGGVTDIIVAILDAIGTNVPKVVNAMYDMIIKMINGLTDSVETKMPQVRSAIKRLVAAIITEFKSAIKDAVSVGGNIVAGLKNGILNGIESVKEAARNVARAALTSAKKFLGIFSPSREFKKLGKYSDEGFAEGFSKNSDIVEDSVSDVANLALSGMRSAMAAASDFLNLDPDAQPVIRPVLDLSEIQNGAGQIGSLINGNYAIQASGVNARNVSSNIKPKYDVSSTDSTPAPVNNTNNNSITNHFSITGSNPREIANEVSAIIQKQVERRNSLWE